MERELEKDLLKRKESPFRKPLIIQGADFTYPLSRRKGVVVYERKE